MSPLLDQLAAPITTRIEHNGDADGDEAIRDRSDRSIDRSQSRGYELLFVVYRHHYTEPDGFRRGTDSRADGLALQGH